MILGSLTVGTAGVVAVVTTLNGWLGRLIDIHRERIVERERRATVLSVLHAAPPGSAVIERRADGTCLSVLAARPVPFGTPTLVLQERLDEGR